MPKQTDENGITWDIKTTIVQVGTKPPEASWFAAVDDDSPRAYTGNQFPIDDEETFAPSGTDARLTWPAQGNPILRGKGNVDDATATIKLFAARSKNAISLRVRESGGGGGLFLALIIVGLILTEGKKRRR
jgi:hypothetical protein